MQGGNSFLPHSAHNLPNTDITRLETSTNNNKDDFHNQAHKVDNFNKTKMEIADNNTSATTEPNLLASTIITHGEVCICQ